MSFSRLKPLTVTMLATALAACMSQPMADRVAAVSMETAPDNAMAHKSVVRAERLGTQWGDEVQSSVRHVNLIRVDSQPLAEHVLHYSAKDYRGRSLNSISLAAGRVVLSVQGDNRHALPIFRDNGRYFLRGKAGQAYQLVYQNNSDKTLEIVASVDGLDVISGRAASRYHSGYVLRPHGTLRIEGFRKSDSSVASFIFGKPSDAYAAHSDAGLVQNVGVIGTAVFELRDPNRAPEGAANAFPADGERDNGYAKAPR